MNLATIATRFMVGAALVAFLASGAFAADDCCDAPPAASVGGHYHGHAHDYAAPAADDCCDGPAGAASEGAGHYHGHGHAHGHDHSAGDECSNCADAASHGAAAVTEAPEAPEAWGSEILDRFRNLPVQDGGRVKPLSTLARFTLLQLSGRTTVENADGRRLSATEWLLDSLFYPRYAEHSKIFLIQSPEVMDTLGLDHDKPRDRFSYAQLRPARATLFQLAQQAAHLEQYEKTRVQEQILHLAHNVNEFELLTHYFQFARRQYNVGESETLKEIFGEVDSVSYSDAIARGPEVVDALIKLRRNETDEDFRRRHQSEMDHVSRFFRHLEMSAETAYSLAMFPPPPAEKDEADWYAPGDMLMHFLEPPQDGGEHARLLGELEALERKKDDRAAFAAHLDELYDGVVAAAAERGELRGVNLESTYYQLGLLDYSLYLYVLAFILAAFAWMRPHSRLLWWAAFLGAAAPLALHTAAITIRCIIRARPPATTLYETILFTGAVAVLCALCMEYINRRRIGVGVAAFIGALGLFLANRYEIQEGVDTMPPLIAVLDTNFWLSIHVITMVMGYAGSLLAAGIAHIYLFGKAFNFRPGHKDFYKSLTRMTYGALCFALLFNTAGTVIGGLWAADSWGRFWGWDPKENGALIVVLWGLILLHARMGGYIRDHGLQMGAVFGGVTVAFAWFGVNLLGVGLHSYGFTDGVHGALNTFYASQSFVLFVGAVGWMRLNGMFRLAKVRAAGVDD